MDAKSMPAKDLKAAIKAFNLVLVQDEKEKIKFVGIKKIVVLENLKAAIDVYVDAEETDGLPEVVVDFYNTYFGEQEESTEDTTEETKSSSTKKSNKKDTEETKNKKSDKKESKSKKSDKKESKSKGYIEPNKDTQAFRIDTMLKKGTTIDKIIEKQSVSKGRVTTRIKAIIDRGANLTEKDGVYTLVV